MRSATLISVYLNSSILGRAQKRKKIKFSFYNPRDFVKPTNSQNKNEKPYLRVDDKPYGGGVGMVLQAEPILKAFTKVEKKIKGKKKVVDKFLEANRR